MARRLKALANPILEGDRGPQKILGAILILGFLIRTWLCFFAHLPHWYKDSYEYLQQADTLLAGGYTNYFPNGYPAMIAMLKVIAGRSGLTVAILSVNILMATMAIYFAYDIASRVFQRVSVALFAAFLIAVFPTQLNYVRWVSTEVPTEFFLLGAYFFYYREKKWLSGLFFGLATVVRTDEAPIFILLILLGMIWQKKINARLIIAAVVPLLLVGYYCYRKTGNFSLAGHGKANIMYSITASGGDVDYYYQDKHPEVKTSGQALKMYVDHMKESPSGFIRQRLANLWELWGFYPSSSEGNRGWVSRLSIGLGNAFMLCFGFYGWWKKRKDFSAFVLILPFAVATPIHTLLLAIPRYTFTVEPFMILLASWALYWIVWGRKNAPMAYRPGS